MTFQARDVHLVLLLATSVCLQVYFVDKSEMLFSTAGQGGFVIEKDNDASCTTSEGQSGSCIVLTKCNYAMDIIEKNGIASRLSQNFLRPNQCGFENNNPKICCPKRNDNSDERNPFEEKGNQDSNNEIGDSPGDPYGHPLSLLPDKCGRDDSNRIIGGEVMELDKFPWMAVLEYQRGGGGPFTAGCGGALITRRYVLTAAHCIRSIPSTWHLVNVRLGVYNMRTNPDCVDEGNGERTCADPILSVPVEREIVHENYMKPELYRNDIALLRLAYDVPTTRYIQPICLPESASAGSFYWSAGWGQIEYKPSSPMKLKVSLPFVNLYQCAVTYRSKRVILGEGQMCAGRRAGKDTCKGDSGGPLMKQVRVVGQPNRWVVDGVVSIGHSPCGLSKWPGVYTKVYNYVDWIHSKLRPQANIIRSRCEYFLLLALFIKLS